jgi:DNA polymerase-3 subunit beta
MKFVVSSTELLGHLQAISRVISSKNTLPILDNFLFSISGNDLEITASDLESTLITRMRLDNITGSGTIALPARILLDTLKEFSEQPLAFDVNPDTMAVVINSENGRFSIVGQNGIDFLSFPLSKRKNVLASALRLMFFLPAYHAHSLPPPMMSCARLWEAYLSRLLPRNLRLWHPMHISW